MYSPFVPSCGWEWAGEALPVLVCNELVPFLSPRSELGVGND